MTEKQTSTQPKSWRDVIEVHPAADLFPMMSDDELRAQGEDIKKNGLRFPVVLWSIGDDAGPEPNSKPPNPHYRLLDGRNRLDAAELVGLTVSIDTKRGEVSIEDPNTGRLRCRTERLFEFKVSWDGFNKLKPVRKPWIDPYAYVMSANLHRRHLTPEQRREVAAKILKAQPRKSNREVAKLAKVDHKTVGAIREGLEAVGEIPHLTKTTGADGKSYPTRVPKPPKPKQTDLEEVIGEPAAAAVVGNPPSPMDRFYDCLKQMREMVSQVMQGIEPARRRELFCELRLALDDLDIAMSPPEKLGFVQGKIDQLEIPEFLLRKPAVAASRA